MPQRRHTCYRCGGSCQGPGPVVAPKERAAIQAAAVDLELETPFISERIRTVANRCLFLQQDNLCQLEILGGPTAKPRACQVFPTVHLSIDGTARIGVDPGCLTGFLSSTTGDTLPHPKPEWHAPDPLEQAVLDNVTGSIAHALAQLDDAPTLAGRMPAALSRWFEGIRPSVIQLLVHPGTAPALRARLRHLDAIDPVRPLQWDLSPSVEGHALDVVNQMVLLRLGSEQGERAARSTARDTLIGASLCAAAGPELARFAPALAAWTRLQRTNALRSLLDS